MLVCSLSPALPSAHQLDRFVALTDGSGLVDSCTHPHHRRVQNRRFVHIQQGTGYDHFLATDKEAAVEGGEIGRLVEADGDLRGKRPRGQSKRGSSGCSSKFFQGCPRLLELPGISSVFVLGVAAQRMLHSQSLKKSRQPQCL